MKILRRSLLLACCALPGVALPATADEKGWTGAYAGTIQSEPAELLIETSGSLFSGRIDAAGYPYDLYGTVDGASAEGVLSDPGTLAAMRFTAALDGDDLALTLLPAEAAPLELAFVRSRGQARAPPGLTSREAAPYPVDARIVGGWVYSSSYTSGDYSFATQYRMRLAADGTYLYGDGRVIGGGPDVSADSGTGDVTQGRWGARDGILYVDDGSGWADYAGYQTDGANLLLQFGNGSKQIWERTE